MDDFEVEDNNFDALIKRAFPNAHRELMRTPLSERKAVYDRFLEGKSVVDEDNL